MKYKNEVTKAMTMLGQDSRTIFLGQSVKYPGHVLFGTLGDIPMNRRIEMPIAEDMQMGISIGLALEGYIPVTIYPRIDFLILALNQLLNHLDKIEEMSEGQYRPKVIVRTMVGSKVPMNPGPQHCSDYTEGLQKMLTNIRVYKLERSGDIFKTYKKALEEDKSVVIIEMADLYD